MKEDEIGLTCSVQGKTMYMVLVAKLGCESFDILHCLAHVFSILRSNMPEIN
jgi:hypothetical protein